MPQPIYLPRNPSFMEEFSPYLNNIMQSIMMGVQNRREDEKTARGYQDKGYTETTPMTPTEQAAAPQSPQERAAFESGPRGQYWQQRTPDVTVGGAGTFGAPKRGFRKPVEPKATFGVEQGTGKQDWAVVRKGTELVSASLIKTKAPKDLDNYKQLPPKTVNGSKLFPQKNLKTGKIEYFRVPPSAKGGAGGGKNALNNEQKIITIELNEIRKAHNIGGSIDILALQTLKGDQRNAYMNKFTKGVADQLPPKAKTRYIQLTKKLQSITNKIPGGLPKQRQELRRGTEAGTGKTVIEYDDGTVEYAE